MGYPPPAPARTTKPAVIHPNAAGSLPAACRQMIRQNKKQTPGAPLELCRQNPAGNLPARHSCGQTCRQIICQNKKQKVEFVRGVRGLFEPCSRLHNQPDNLVHSHFRRLFVCSRLEHYHRAPIPIFLFSGPFSDPHKLPPRSEFKVRTSMFDVRRVSTPSYALRVRSASPRNIFHWERRRPGVIFTPVPRLAPACHVSCHAFKNANPSVNSPLPRFAPRATALRHHPPRANFLPFGVRSSMLDVQCSMLAVTQARACLPRARDQANSRQIKANQAKSREITVVSHYFTNSLTHYFVLSPSPVHGVHRYVHGPHQNETPCQ